ncbi:3-alpha-hydroxysteroid dehydrogenase [Pseudoalteromonas sp. NBT06-2]|uniref:coniferyl-alcohol dehydrogenase n=1 Tax=Pseudoalteromonas sp. NBT06-2 TaxID=2025950 RepID=UPI000BA74661|nr:coniferyl-alcohol dehydrogenase [Pseudoalteromonas sp. NBT06-2]PAJ72454.1 3-alpha-hydroxysteroid dehydrogenase [Pseudoalteromonas sp. NBT06-2]
MNLNKKIIVTGAASGIGAETVRVLKQQGAKVIGVDRNPVEGVDEFFQVDLSEAAAIDEFINILPFGIDGLANIAGLPPTSPAESVLKVNILGLKRLTLGLIDKMADGASIVNLASLAGFGWTESIDQVKQTLALDFNSDIAAFVTNNDLGTGGRSYFLAKEALLVWTMQNRWTWRNRGINMNAVSPGAVDTPILSDFIKTLGARAEEDMRVLDRPATPSDIAPVVVFALSDDANWFRGANLTADGGMFPHLMSKIYQI